MEAAEGESKDFSIHNKSISDQFPRAIKTEKQLRIGREMIRVVYGDRSLLILTILLHASTSLSGSTVDVPTRFSHLCVEAVCTIDVAYCFKSHLFCP